MLSAILVWYGLKAFSTTLSTLSQMLQNLKYS